MTLHQDHVNTFVAAQPCHRTSQWQCLSHHITVAFDILHEAFCINMRPRGFRRCINGRWLEEDVICYTNKVDDEENESKTTLLLP
jgi:hypothetical protein